MRRGSISSWVVGLVIVGLAAGGSWIGGVSVGWADSTTDHGTGTKGDKKRSKGKEFSGKQSESEGQETTKGNELRSSDNLSVERRRSIEKGLARELSSNSGVTYTLNLGNEAVAWLDKGDYPEFPRPASADARASAQQGQDLDVREKGLSRAAGQAWWDPEAMEAAQTEALARNCRTGVLVIACHDLYDLYEWKPEENRDLFPDYAAWKASVVAAAFDLLQADLKMMQPFRLSKDDAEAIMRHHVDDVVQTAKERPYRIAIRAFRPWAVQWTRCKESVFQGGKGYGFMTEHLTRQPRGEGPGQCEAAFGHMVYDEEAVTGLDVQYDGCRWSWPPGQLVCGAKVMYDPQSGEFMNRRVLYEARSGVSLSDSLRRVAAGTEVESFAEALSRYTSTARKHGYVREAALLEREGIEIAKTTSFEQNKKQAIGLLESVNVPTQVLSSLKSLFKH